MEFTITLTDVEVKALSYVMADPVAWTQNAISERARIAGLDIIAAETQRLMADPDVTQIPASAEQIILGAPDPVFVDPSNPPELS